jgi:hypothetical protein
MTDETRTRPRRSGGSGIVFPLILIAAGLLFLLDNFGTVEVDWWELWRLWPLLLVLGGLDLLLGGRSVLGNLVVAVLAIGILAAALYVVGVRGIDDTGLTGDVRTIAVDEPLGGAELAELDVHMAAGNLTIVSHDYSHILLEGALKVEREEPLWEVARDGSTVRMTLDQTGGKEGRFDLGATHDWRLLLSPEVGYNVQVELGAGTAELDLTGLDLRGLIVDAGAARTEITFPASGDYAARVDGGVGGLELTIPREVAVRLTLDRGLTTLDLPARYRQQGGSYITEGWINAETRLDLIVDMGVGLLTIRDG